MKRIHLGKLFIKVMLAILLLVNIVGYSNVNANHGSTIHNATEQNAGNWYGSRATINWTNPNLNGGQWVYVRTSSNHQVQGYCFRFSEIGWYKTTSSLKGLVIWDSGCSRKDLTFNITAATHTYSQQYFESGGVDRYAWYVDGSYIGSGQTNFFYTTTVTCGGEVATGVESMGNTRCGSNYKLRKNTDGTYTFILWGGHTNYVDDPPYYNTNDPSDPDNSFFSLP
jgi:hypothetical protein